MPYIKENRRALRPRANIEPDNVGELTYQIYSVILAYYRLRVPCYGVIAEIRGALWGALREFDRTIADPYEESKRKANGDVI